MSNFLEEFDNAVETSVSEQALRGSSYTLDQDAVVQVLDSFDMPIECPVRIIGTLPSENVKTTINNNHTYHYLPVLPRDNYIARFSSERAVTRIDTFNKVAIESLYNIAQIHKSGLDPLNPDQKRIKLTNTMIQNGCVGATFMVLNVMNGALAWRGAEDILDSGYASVPGTGALAALSSYTLYNYFKDQKIAIRAQKEHVRLRRKRLIDDTARFHKVVTDF